MEIQIFNFSLDFTPLFNIGNEGILATSWYIFINGGWVFFAYITAVFIFYLWWMSRQGKWAATNKFILLAVDVPKDTEQTPKAVEQLFSTLSGAHTEFSKWEIYYKGMFQLAFSFEIVSIDGYVQFLIRTPSHFRDLVESSIYSQYPDAEITEVEDYTKDIPAFPNDQFKMWGAEIVLANKDVYPIRTYPFFEDKVSGEYKDPVASILETMSKIKAGEQVWLQIIVKPTGFDWPKRATAEAFKLAGKKMPAKPVGVTAKTVEWTYDTLRKMGDSLIPVVEGGETKSKDDLPSLMLHLTPGQRAAIEAIENKSSKMGFLCKMRLIYFAPEDVYSAGRVVSAVFGSIKQFAVLDLNSFKPDKKTKTSVPYFSKMRYKERSRKLMMNYKFRESYAGAAAYILNTEELASLWHFPSKYITAPSLRKTTAKKTAAPASLPVVEEENSGTKEELKKQLENTNYSFDLDNNYFEDKFAKKSPVAPVRGKNQPPANLPTVE